ncbi:ADP-ribosylation_factor 1 [Hexamita inflata]|uniref:ADP-ribosylation factor 1 n=1 Tax=Hexamita inflata TaxID=28002 RepID=A0AA86P2T3_9EUKA|nr:ADP-ribosylation factor 1 [Hexamita inflata]
MKNIINLISGKPQEIRAVMLGLDNSGKTKILQQWKQSEVVQTNPTIGFNFETIQTQKQNVSIWLVVKLNKEIYGHITLLGQIYQYLLQILPKEITIESNKPKSSCCNCSKAKHQTRIHF